VYKEVTDFQLIKLLFMFISNADSHGNVSFTESFQCELYSLFENGNTLDYLLYKMNEDGVITYMEIGEEGFKPVIEAAIDARTKSYAIELLSKIELGQIYLNDKINSLNKRVNELFLFDHGDLLRSIDSTNGKIAEIEKVINGSEVMESLAKPLSQIKSNFASLAVVTNNYDEVYKNIIKPIQNEGRSGIKATVRWAVISIIISGFLSWAVGKYTSVSDAKNVGTVNVSAQVTDSKGVK
jgi:hypothetical protein